MINCSIKTLRSKTLGSKTLGSLPTGLIAVLAAATLLALLAPAAAQDRRQNAPGEFDFYVLSHGKLAGGRMIVPAVFLVAAATWLSRQTARLAFWLPQENLAWAAKRSILGTYRDWSTLIWLFVYALLWMFVLGFSD